MIALLILLNTNKLLYELDEGIVSTFRVIEKLVSYPIDIGYIGTSIHMIIDNEVLWSFRGIIRHRSAYYV